MLDRDVTVEVPVSVEALHEIVSDLATYTEWLDLVSDVEPAEPDAGDNGPAWTVTLRAQIGRFARTKRLRMVRVPSEVAHTARFERREIDGRDHAAWILACQCVPITTSTSGLDLSLTYTGALWSAILDSLLGDEIAQAVDRLPAYAVARQQR